MAATVGKSELADAVDEGDREGIEAMGRYEGRHPARDDGGRPRAGELASDRVDAGFLQSISPGFPGVSRHPRRAEVWKSHSSWSSGQPDGEHRG